MNYLAQGLDSGIDLGTKLVQMAQDRKLMQSRLQFEAAQEQQRINAEKALNDARIQADAARQQSQQGWQSGQTQTEEAFQGKQAQLQRDAEMQLAQSRIEAEAPLRNAQTQGWLANANLRDTRADDTGMVDVTETDPNNPGKTYKYRVPASQLPTAGAPGQSLPTSTPYDAKLSDLSQQIAQHKMLMAQGNMHTWYGGSRAGIVNDLQSQYDAIAKLKAASGPTPAGAPGGTPVPGATSPSQPLTAIPGAASAMAWAQANPSDPRAAAIMRRLGMPGGGGASMPPVTSLPPVQSDDGEDGD